MWGRKVYKEVMARELGGRPVVCGVRKAQKGKCLKNDGVINCFVCWLLTGLMRSKTEKYSWSCQVGDNW